MMAPLNQQVESLVQADSAPLNSEPLEASSDKNILPDVPTFSSDKSNQLAACAICSFSTATPKVFPCMHTFCQDCLTRHQENNDKFSCPCCEKETYFSSQEGLDLIPDLAIKNAIGVIEEDPKIYCTLCKNKYAVVRCCDCSNFLCTSCTLTHHFLHGLDNHRVVKLSSDPLSTDPHDGPVSSQELSSLSDKRIPCPRHKTEPLCYFCKTCCVPICNDCSRVDHPAGLHEWSLLDEEAPKQLEILAYTIEEAKSKAVLMRNVIKTHENSNTQLKAQYLKAQNEIVDTFQFYMSLLEERKEELTRELESVYTTKKVALDVFFQKNSEIINKIDNFCEYSEKLMKQANIAECLLLKKFIEAKLQNLTSKFNIEDSMQSIFDFEFVSNFQAIQVGVKNTFGYIRSGSEGALIINKQPPIARPSTMSLLTNTISTGNLSTNIMSSILNNSGFQNGFSERKQMNALENVSSLFQNTTISARFPTTSSFGPFPTSVNTVSSSNYPGIKQYEKWSNVSENLPTTYSLTSTSHDESFVDVNSKLLPSPILPCKSPVKRQKMIYYCKFGEFGFLEGQFTEPSGVAVNAQNDIIVADTNSHRIQIFDKEGRFKFQFGEVGKRDGQFSYPNRVAVVKTSGDIIVTERSPTHQVQIYNQYGQFVRKFGSNILQYPRGVAVDHKGRIIIVECKVMRVIIFDQSGNVIKKFGCSKHVEFPNGVVVNEKEEIFISDNRAHCVKVFNYEGVFLRQIGSYGIINYPIGVGISPSGEILIADNHNNFNLTIFTQEGQLISALESKIKHAQCFDVALMDDGSVVLASKDYRLYIYRYVPLPPL